MKYQFELRKYFDERDGLNKETPCLIIENQEQYGYYFYDEIKNLDIDYLEEIVSSLEKVLNGELEQYDFGYEVYSIECRKDISQVIDTFDGWKSIAEIPTQELYELMRDWREFRIKNG